VTRLAVAALLLAVLAGGYLAVECIHLTGQRTVDVARIAVLERTVADLRWDAEVMRLRDELADYYMAALDDHFPKLATILRAAWFHGRIERINPALILQLVRVESDFNPAAISWADCRGLTQINPVYWPVNVARLHSDVEYAIAWGVRVLAQYLEQTGGEIDRALRLYHGRTVDGVKERVYAEKIMRGVRE
jgi:soluble lytic murein transglycosylase-like protein